MSKSSSFNPEKIKISFLSLGCPRNLADSEILINTLRLQGFKVTEKIEKSDVLIINTCTFIEDATQESIDVILKAADLKKEGLIKGILAYGCMVQRYKDKLTDLLPEIDGFCGVDTFEQVPQAIKTILKNEKTSVFPQISKKRKYYLNFAKERMLSPSHIGYVKISEGCMHRCSFCIIPSIKGPHRSRPIKNIMEEVEYLVKVQKVSEIVLIAQDSSTYGIDLYKKCRLPELIRRVSQAVPENVWVRLLYIHPEGLTDDILYAIVQSPNVCRYIDIPIEHASTRVLKDMKRRYTNKDLVQLINKVRTKIPGAFIRTSVILGFPGETDKDFRTLLNFIEKVGFEKLGAFIYSNEEGTLSYSSKKQISLKTARNRFNQVMKTQLKISEKVCEKFIGTHAKVLVDGISEEGDYLLCRTEFDAPEVDGIVMVKGKKAKPGTFIEVKFTDSLEYDLIAERI